MMSTPFISVIVAERNSRRTMRRCLDSLTALAYPAYEILVIDDGSTDDTPAILSAYTHPCLRVIFQANAGPAAARNAAVSRARGELVAFTDGDCIVDPAWLSELVAGLGDEATAAAGGSQGIPDDESDFGRLVSRFFTAAGFVTDYSHAAAGDIRTVDHNPSCNSLYRKKAFLEAQGFTPGLWPGEDVDLDLRLRRKGYTIRFNPRAMVRHYRCGDLRSFCRMMTRYGWAQGILCRRYGVTRKIHLVPIALLAGAIALAVAPLALAVAAAASMLFLLVRFRFDLAAFGLLFPAFIYWNAGFVSGFAPKPSIFLRANNEDTGNQPAVRS